MKNTTLVFGGDFCPIRGYERQLQAGAPVFEHALSEVFEAGDFAMVNLECPLCPATLPPASKAGYGLRIAPELAGTIKALGIDAVGLANNHIRDYQDAGVISTLQALDDAGMIHTGAGPNLAAAQKPLFLEVKGRKICIWALAEREHNPATDTAPGSSVFFPELNVQEIPKLKAAADWLAIYVHAGHEFTDVPSPRIRAAYRAFVDAGADAVIGHHPHVPQGFERYKQGVIFYSLGNLVFDSDYVAKHRDTDIGYLVRFRLRPDAASEFDVIPYRMGADFCVRRLQNAELRATEEHLHKLSAPLADARKHEAAWRADVARRWREAYQPALAGFSKNFADRNNLHFIRLAKNYFGCPTHQEMLTWALTMVDEGELSRE